MRARKQEIDWTMLEGVKPILGTFSGEDAALIRSFRSAGPKVAVLSIANRLGVNKDVVWGALGIVRKRKRKAQVSQCHTK